MTAIHGNHAEKGGRGQGLQGKAEDTDGPAPAKDGNAAIRFPDR